jgi:hypothetical protein
MSLNTKLYFQISHAIVNHFKPFEVPNAQGVKIYEEQAIVLRNKEIEKPTRFEELSESVVFWLLEVETDTLLALEW